MLATYGFNFHISPSGHIHFTHLSNDINLESLEVEYSCPEEANLDGNILVK